MTKQAERNWDYVPNLRVTNFGPISEASVNLKPLTVLVGPSNTGKSYFAILLYAFARSFSYHYPSGPSLVRAPRFLDSKNFHHLTEFIDELESKINLQENFSLHLNEKIKILFEESFKVGLLKFTKELNRCFGVSHSDFFSRKNQKSPAKIEIKFSHHQNKNVITNSVELSRGPKCESIFPDKIHIDANSLTSKEEIKTYEVEDLFFKLKQVAAMFKEDLSHLRQDLSVRKQDFSINYYFESDFSRLINVIQSEIIGLLGSNAFYLPADRTGIMHAHTVVVSSLIASAPMAGLREPTAKVTMTGVLADFLEQLIFVDSNPYKTRSKNNFHKEIEKGILQGKIDSIRTQVADYPEFVYIPKGWEEELSLANASSMVSELAPIVLLLKHKILPGNLLIIEEPESHLHPGVQVRLMNELAQLVTKGIRIVITTHSEWLLEALNNIVGRSRIKCDQEQSDKSVSLSPNQVGLWLFKKSPRKNGTIVKEIPLDDTGQYPNDFGDVIVELHNEWARIQTQLENGHT